MSEQSCATSDWTAPTTTNTEVLFTANNATEGNSVLKDTVSVAVPVPSAWTRASTLATKNAKCRKWSNIASICVYMIIHIDAIRTLTDNWLSTETSRRESTNKTTHWRRLMSYVIIHRIIITHKRFIHILFYNILIQFSKNNNRRNEFGIWNDLKFSSNICKRR